MEKRLSHCFERGKTCLGRSIYLPETTRQNWARKAVSNLSVQLKRTLERQSYDERLLGEAIERLRLNLSNPIHYGDNKPGWTFGEIPGNPKPGTSVVPDARFNYFDLFSFGISGDDGYAGFLRDCGLVFSTPYTHVVAATALLLLDEAIQALEAEDPWYATWVLYQAHDLLEELQSRESEKEVESRERKTFAIAGARGRHAETDKYKAEILDEWKTGRFKGKKSACINWAIKQYPIKPITVRRHLVAYERGTLQAKC